MMCLYYYYYFACGHFRARVLELFRHALHSGTKFQLISTLFNTIFDFSQ